MAFRSPLHKGATTFALVMLSMISLQAEAANIYRYVDKDGRTVWDSKIPQEYVRNGYTILNERGQVLQVVPRALTAEEVAAQQEELAARKRAEEEAIAQQQADSLLLRLYRSPGDIQRKLDEKLEQLEVQRTVLTAARAKTEQEVTRLQSVIANTEKLGQTPGSDTVESLKFQTNEMERVEGLLAKLDEEEVKARTEAERDSARLIELLGGSE